MNDLKYEITLTPDLDQMNFVGKAVINLRQDFLSGDKVVELDAMNLEILDCAVNGTSLVYHLDQDNQKLRFRLPASAGETIVVSIDYLGRISKDYAGLYRTKYQANQKTYSMFTTQFQAMDACRVFPCFDHPAQKALLEITVIIDQHLEAVSNMPVTIQQQISPEKKSVHFAPTPKMSPYHIFIGIGEFEVIQDTEEVPLVRVYTGIGRIQKAQFALDYGRKALSYCAEFTKIPYPLPKCDFLAVPGSIGAMENFGAIRHAEEMLLVDADTSFETRKKIAGLIAHEVSHMWFGNLVTLSDWHMLWLNEAFATFFTYEIPSFHFPEWNVWEDFASGGMQTALERDGLSNTIPIERPLEDVLGKNPAPTPSSAPIIYQKGAGILRMLQAWIGKDTFRRAMEEYLTQNMYANVESKDLWSALSPFFNRGIELFSASWFESPGYPLVSVCRDADMLVLKQQRFSYAGLRHDQLWPIPLELKFYNQDEISQCQRIWFDQPEVRIPLPEDFSGVLVNSGREGFYRVAYEDSLRDFLGLQAANGVISNIDFHILQNDLFALVLGGKVLVADYLDFVLAHFKAAGSSRFFKDILENLLTLKNLSPGNFNWYQSANKILQYSVVNLNELLVDLDSKDISLLEKWLLAGYLFQVEEINAITSELWQNFIRGELENENIASGLLCAGMAIDPQVFLMWRMVKAYKENLSQQEKFLKALGWLQDTDLLIEALTKNLEEVARHQKIIMMLSAAENPVCRAWYWDWCNQQKPQLEKLHPSHYARLMLSVIKIAGKQRAQEVEAFLEEAGQQFPDLADSFLMAFDWMKIFNSSSIVESESE
jgi:tricorn protease interacting factor F2/3